MNLHLRPNACVKLLATATAMPLDLPGQRGVLLDDEAVHERVLGPGWREHTASQPLQSGRTRQWVQGANGLDLAIEAAQRALQRAALAATDLAAIICVTSTPPVISAAMAARIGRALGCTSALCHASAMDVRAGGVGVMLAWFNAQGLIVQGSGPVLIVAAEAASSFLTAGDIGSALLYADGAGAAILAGTKPGAEPGVEAGHEPSASFLGGLSGQVALPGRPTTIPGLLPPEGDLAAYRYQRPDREHLQALHALWRTFPGELSAAFPQAHEALRHLLPYAVSQGQMDAALQAMAPTQAQLFHELPRHGCVGAASPLVALHGLLESGRTQAGDVIALLSAAGNGLWAGFYWRLS